MNGYRSAALLLMLAGTAQAGEPRFRLLEAKYGKGEVEYDGAIPVLVLAGTPEEMGEQMGVLGVKPAAAGAAVLKELLKKHKLDLVTPLLVAFGEAQLAKYPAAYRKEFEAM